MNTLLFGGTFDPVHLGHLKAAAAVQQHFHFEQFLFVPCRLPVHKAHPNTPPEHRIAMLQAALVEYPIENAALSLDEIKRTSPSYTIDTLTIHRKRLGPTTPLIFLLGMDSFLSFPAAWGNFHELLHFAHLLIMHRPTATDPMPPVLTTLLHQYQTQHQTDLTTQPHGRIYLCHAGNFPISSTDVRQRLYTGQSVQSLLCQCTIDYIQHHGLYRESGRASVTIHNGM